MIGVRNTIPVTDKSASHDEGATKVDRRQRNCCLRASNRAASIGVSKKPGCRYPMRQTLFCCARATSGHAAAPGDFRDERASASEPSFLPVRIATIAAPIRFANVGN